MTTTHAAIVLGASGSVGEALMHELIGNGSFRQIVTLVRRAIPGQVVMAHDASVALRQIVLADMTPGALETATIAAVQSLDADVAGLSVLGIGAGTAQLSVDQHRAVDVELNAAFAAALKQSGRATHLAFLSAVGADSSAAATGSGAAGMARYRRVKGEAEAAVQAVGPAVVTIFRPAMIIGSKHTPAVLAKLLPLLTFVTPAKYKSITVEQIAKAMVATALRPPERSTVYYYPEMIALGR